MTFPTFLKIQFAGRDVTGRDEDRPSFITREQWRRMVKASLIAAGQHWATTFLPLHFSKAAYYRYPSTYTRRSDAYYKRHHVKKQPGQDLKTAIAAARSAHNPLVFSGRLQMATRLAVLRVFQTRVSVQIETLPYLIANAQPGKVNVMAELSAVNSTEVAALGNVAQRALMAAVKRFTANRQLPALAAGSIPANSGLVNLTV